MLEYGGDEQREVVQEEIDRVIVQLHQPLDSQKSFQLLG
jgi:hypothetical protein